MYDKVLPRAVSAAHRSACLLAVDDREGALRAGEAAVAADATFEKGHLRCGAALELLPGGARTHWRRTGEWEATKRP